MYTCERQKNIYDICIYASIFVRLDRELKYVFFIFAGSCAQDAAVSWKLTSQRNNSYVSSAYIKNLQETSGN